MKQIKLLSAVVLMTALMVGNVCAQKQNFPSKKKAGQSEMVDTRIDAMRYWQQLAEDGIIPVQQKVPIAPAEFTGSVITAKSIKGTMEDSPDVALTDATNVSESENSVFVDPSNIDNILNSNNSTSWNGGSVGTLYGANYFISNDGGLSWGGSAQGAGGGNSGDPTTSINLDGSRWYVNYISNPGGMGIAYSTNAGTSWTAATIAPNPGSLADKNHMWIDNSSSSPYQGNLYVAWTPFGGGNDSEIVMARSTNGGTTWSSQVNISSAVNAGSHNQGVNVQTGPNGEVYACWAIYDGWPTDETAIGFAKSTDGGATFAPATRIIQNIRGIRTSETSKNHRVNSFPVMAVDISSGSYSGNIYVTWTNIGVPGINTGNDIDVYIINSSNGGLTWSTPVRINQDPSGQGKEHYFPWITCDAESGILSAIFYDDRNVNSNQCEVFCANSFDGAATWEDFKVSDVSFTPSAIPGLAGGYMGDYLGIMARGSMVYPVWTDNRNGLYMTYTSPFVTNNLPKPTNLVLALDEITGAVGLQWEFETVPGFQHFVIYRDGEELTTTTNLTYTDNLPDYGVFTYSVTAMHDDGESVGASASIQWGNPHIATFPVAIDEILAPGESTVIPIGIENVGELELTYTISTEITSGKGVKSYCAASGGCDEYISQVIFGDIDNSSSCDNYADYTNMSTTINVDETYPLTIVNGNTYSADDIGVWIDWNQDDDFSDAGENVVCDIDNGGQGTYDITVPSTALPGETRMRIRMKWSGSDCGDPCGTTSYGEVEDYTVSVLGWLLVSPTSGTVPAGTLTGVSATLDAADLIEGTYTANINISSNDPDMPMVTIPVTLLVGLDILQVVATIDSAEICEGETAQLFATPEGGSGTYTYSWTSDPAGFTSDEQNPMISPVENTTYTVVVSDGVDTNSDEVSITVNPLPEMPATAVGELTMCQDSPNTTYTSDGTPTALSYNWVLTPVEAGAISGNGEVGIVDWNAEFSGLAYVSLVGVNDCGEGLPSTELEIMIYATPDVSLEVVDSVHVNNIPFELTGGLPVGGVYSGDGVSNSMFDPEAAGMGDHVITYTYEENGCSNFAEKTIYVGDVSGIGEQIRDLSMQIFPNPNTGVFRIKLQTRNQQSLRLKVLNNVGVEVYTQDDVVVNQSWENEMDLSSLSQGVYFIHIYNDDFSVLKKLVLRK